MAWTECPVIGWPFTWGGVHETVTLPGEKARVGAAGASSGPEETTTSALGGDQSPFPYAVDRPDAVLVPAAPGEPAVGAGEGSFIEVVAAPDQFPGLPGIVSEVVAVDLDLVALDRSAAVGGVVPGDDVGPVFGYDQRPLGGGRPARGHRDLVGGGRPGSVSDGVSRPDPVLVPVPLTQAVVDVVQAGGRPAGNGLPESLPVSGVGVGVELDVVTGDLVAVVPGGDPGDGVAPVAGGDLGGGGGVGGAHPQGPAALHPLALEAKGGVGPHGVAVDPPLDEVVVGAGGDRRALFAGEEHPSALGESPPASGRSAPRTWRAAGRRSNSGRSHSNLLLVPKGRGRIRPQRGGVGLWGTLNVWATLGLPESPSRYQVVPGGRRLGHMKNPPPGVGIGTQPESLHGPLAEGERSSVYSVPSWARLKAKWTSCPPRSPVRVPVWDRIGTGAAGALPPRPSSPPGFSLVLKHPPSMAAQSGTAAIRRRRGPPRLIRTPILECEGHDRTSSVRSNVKSF